MASRISATGRDGCDAGPRQKNCHQPRYHPEVSSRRQRFWTRATETHAISDLEIMSAYSTRASDGRLLAPSQHGATCASPVTPAFSTWVTSVNTRDTGGFFVNRVAEGKLNLRKIAVFAIKSGAIPLYNGISSELHFSPEFQNSRHPKTPKTRPNIVSASEVLKRPFARIKCFEKVAVVGADANLEKKSAISWPETDQPLDTPPAFVPFKAEQDPHAEHRVSKSVSAGGNRVECKRRIHGIL